MARARSRAASIGVGFAALAIYVVSLAPELAPRGGLENDRPFQATDPLWLQHVLSFAGSAESWWPSGALAAAWISLPGSSNFNLASAALAASAAALLTQLIAGISATPVAVAAGLGFALSPAVWAVAVAAEGSVSAPIIAVAVLTSLLCLNEWQRSGRAAALLGVGGALMVAACEDLSAAIVAAPMLTCAAAHTRPFRRWWMLAMVGGVGVAALYQGWQLRALLGAAAVDGGVLPDAGRAWVEVWRWGFPSDQSVTAIGGARARDLTLAVTENLGLFGILVAAVGLRWHVSTLAILALCAGAALGPLGAPWDPTTRSVLLLAPLWYLIAMGIARVASWPSAGGPPVAVALCGLLPVLQVLRLAADPQTLVDRPAGGMLGAFALAPTGPADLVADRARVARLLIFSNRRRPSSDQWELAPQDPVRLAQAIEQGRTIVATGPAADRLSLSGLTGELRSVKGRTLSEMLASTDPRALVAVVATAGAFEGQPAAANRLAGLVAERRDAMPLPQGAFVLLARQSEKTSHLLQAASRVDVAGGASLASEIPPSLDPGAGVRLVADPSGARVELGGRELAQVESGAVVVTRSPVNGEHTWSVLDRRDGLTASWEHAGWRFSRLGPRRACVTATSGQWADVTNSTRAARIGVQLARGQRLRLYLARDRGLSVRAAAFPDRHPPEVAVVRWDRENPDQERSAAAALDAAGARPGTAAATVRYIWQVTITASPSEDGLYAVGLGGPPDWAQARVESAASESAVICPGVAGAQLFARDDIREDAISLADGESFGAGWLEMERDGGERWRQTRNGESDLLVRLDVPRTVTMTVTTRPGAAPNAAGRIGLRVNGALLDLRDLQGGGNDYTWTVPESRWLAGTNRLVLVTTPIDASQGNELVPPVLHVTSLRFRR
jgi:hypothetical protein